MAVIRTDLWLEEHDENPSEIFTKLESYFPNASAVEIASYLTWHGMFREPINNQDKMIKQFKERKDIWQLIQKEEQILMKLWDGPNIPIFIFPADRKNPKIMKEQNGKSGIAFKDKLFLFLANDNSNSEIKALFTHEYNHVCRLAHYDKKEEEFVLLDTIILEGLAENAVRELRGEEDLAKWTSYYTSEQLKRMWWRYIFPSRDIPKSHRKHNELLYGLRLLPKKLGYAVGYYLVKEYIDQNHVRSTDLLSLPSETIAQIDKRLILN